MRRGLSRQISGLEEPKQQGDEEFAAGLGELAAFKAEYGRLPDRRSLEASEARLGKWLEAQRDAERQRVLCGLRRSMLREALGQDWVFVS
jgi:hypothetical protein